MIAQTCESIVIEFIAAIEGNDLAAALAHLADDVEYDNVPTTTMHGVDAVRAALAPFLGRFEEVAWPVSHIASAGDATSGVVFTERVDRFRTGDQWVELPVAGMFEVRDGRITVWRDYFDLGTFTTQMAALG